MAKHTIERTDYHNPGTEDVVFDQGTSPNDYAERICVKPGETYKGYRNYKKFYLRNGLKEGPSPSAGQIREEAAEAAAEASKMRAEAEQAKLEALEIKREADAAKADAVLAVAEAEAAKTKAALIEQVDEEPVDETDSDPMTPVSKPAKGKGKGGKGKAK